MSNITTTTLGHCTLTHVDPRTKTSTLTCHDQEGKRVAATTTDRYTVLALHQISLQEDTSTYCTRQGLALFNDAVFARKKPFVHQCDHQAHIHLAPGEVKRLKQAEQSNFSTTMARLHAYGGRHRKQFDVTRVSGSMIEIFQVIGEHRVLTMKLTEASDGSVEVALITATSTSGFILTGKNAEQCFAAARHLQRYGKMPR